MIRLKKKKNVQTNGVHFLGRFRKIVASLLSIFFIIMITSKKKHADFSDMLLAVSQNKLR